MRNFSVSSQFDSYKEVKKPGKFQATLVIGTDTSLAISKKPLYKNIKHIITNWVKLVLWVIFNAATPKQPSVELSFFSPDTFTAFHSGTAEQRGEPCSPALSYTCEKGPKPLLFQGTKMKLQPQEAPACSDCSVQNCAAHWAVLRVQGTALVGRPSVLSGGDARVWTHLALSVTKRWEVGPFCWLIVCSFVFPYQGDVQSTAPTWCRWFESLLWGLLWTGTLLIYWGNGKRTIWSKIHTSGSSILKGDEKLELSIQLRAALSITVGQQKPLSPNVAASNQQGIPLSWGPWLTPAPAASLPQM